VDAAGSRLTWRGLIAREQSPGWFRADGTLFSLLNPSNGAFVLTIGRAGTRVHTTTAALGVRLAAFRTRRFLRLGDHLWSQPCGVERFSILNGFSDLITEQTGLAPRRQGLVGVIKHVGTVAPVRCPPDHRIHSALGRQRSAPQPNRRLPALLRRKCKIFNRTKSA
jgi:hypothetical protein